MYLTTKATATPLLLSTTISLQTISREQYGIRHKWAAYEVQRSLVIEARHERQTPLLPSDVRQLPVLIAQAVAGPGVRNAAVGPALPTEVVADCAVGTLVEATGGRLS